MIRTEKRLRLCNTLLVMLLVFIWGNSLLPGEISQTFSDWVKALLSAVFSGGGSGGGQGSGLLRKAAHFTEFTALGCLLCWRAGMLKKRSFVPALWGVAAACIDEGIQIFSPGRAPRVTDVLLDSCGVLTGLLLLICGYNIVKRKTN